ncbi:MAG: DUF370 domain-containing protein [Sebaldella sp.]|nr:DUF370 domain-containing protein [Sebaldella sp.]
MYIYIENNLFIPLNEIILIIDYSDFFKNKKNTEYFEKNKKKVIDLNERGERTIIMTNDFIYVTSYTNRALKMRADEYEGFLFENEH